MDKKMIILLLVMILVLGLFFCNQHNSNIRTAPQKLSLIELFKNETKREIIISKPVLFKYDNTELSTIQFFGFLLFKTENYNFIQLKYKIINYDWSPFDDKYHFKIDVYHGEEKIQTFTLSIDLNKNLNAKLINKNEMISEDQFTFLFNVDRIEVTVFPIDWKNSK